MSNNLVRFAPSPTGLLHIGHAASVFFTWDCAQHKQENTILRIEDIDQTRCKPDFEQSIYEDLHWLEIQWKTPVRRQSDHMNEYKNALDKLEQKNLLYHCFCTRKEIEAEIRNSPSAPHGPDGALYPGTCRHLSKAEREDRIARGEHYAIRLNTALATKQVPPLKWFDQSAGWQAATPEILGDAVLARKETPASYHLCVTHDDALQGITLVTRGQDLFHATHLHRLLQELLGYPVPTYHHHPLLMDRDGVRFAKRNKGITLRELRNKGFSPTQLRTIINERRIAALYEP